MKVHTEGLQFTSCWWNFIVVHVGPQEAKISVLDVLRTIHHTSNWQMIYRCH